MVDVMPSEPFSLLFYICQACVFLFHAVAIPCVDWACLRWASEWGTKIFGLSAMCWFGRATYVYDQQYVVGAILGLPVSVVCTHDFA